MTAVVVFLVASMVLLGVGYQYLKYSKQQEQSRQERQTYQRYNDYLQSTQETAPTAKNERTRRYGCIGARSSNCQSRRAQHGGKAAKPSGGHSWPGLQCPGVQQTGVTIIDAMDHAQTTGRQR